MVIYFSRSLSIIAYLASLQKNEKNMVKAKLIKTFLYENRFVELIPFVGTYSLKKQYYLAVYSLYSNKYKIRRESVEIWTFSQRSM